jgi:beta-phosphoglucomutase-like phosphatase (HAD superfamily)
VTAASSSAPSPKGAHPVPIVPPTLIERVQYLLCDADGNLFPSEEPAFDASAEVTNAFLASVGIDRRYTATELRQAATGMNFRSTALALADAAGISSVDVEPWVAEERRAVTEHLGRTLRPHEPTRTALTALAGRLRLAAVSSSALSRLAACFTATGLDDLIPPARRYSAEDSLPTPTSKPDPAVYRHACASLGIAPEQGLAVEDAVAGVRSAVGAGCPTVGNLLFVLPEERGDRAQALLAAGALTVVESWQELADLVLPVLDGRAQDSGALTAVAR